MSAWQLGIDFGTSYTVAAVLEDGQVKVVDVESNGQSRIPSVVFLNPDGDILVGSAAQHQAVFSPERFEPSPKRVIADGEVFLGDRFIAVTDLVAAVLRKVYGEACRQHGGTVPSATRVTHPAEWAQSRLNVLRGAIEAAALPHPVLVPEPVAAAAWIAMATTAPGARIAVYDFGGGTFDAAVLTRTDTGFEVTGPPSGRDPLGGEDLDRRIIAYLGQIVSQDAPEAWSSLMNPPDVAWRRSSGQLRAEVQRAKETLSDVLVCQMWIPGVEREIQLTRAELEEMIAADIQETIVSLKEAIDSASLSATDLSGVYLVGGSSRIPLVADAIWRELSVRPTVQENPKSVVAMGAAAWGTQLFADAGGAGHSAASVSVPGGALLKGPDREFASQLVMVTGGGAHGQAPGMSSLLVLERPQSSAIRVRDEPSGGVDVIELSRQVGENRAALMQGYVELSLEPTDLFGLPGALERRFQAQTPSGTVEMFERYLVSVDRAIVIATGADNRATADAITLGVPTLPGAKYFEPTFHAALTPDWVVSERITYNDQTNGHQIVADHVSLPIAITAEQWRDRQVKALLAQLDGGEVAGVVPARVLNRLEGEEVTIRSRSGRMTLLTKLWLALMGDRDAYEVMVTLREREQAMFGPLAGLALLNPSVRPPRITSVPSAPAP